MKNFFNLILLGLMMSGCSLEESSTNQDLFIADAEYSSQEASVNICGSSENYNLGTSGNVLVSNDDENLYIRVTSVEGLMMNKTFLHIADDLKSFPTVGQGNLPPGQMHHQVNLDPVTNSYTFTFNRKDLTVSNNCVVIASMTSFTNGSTLWAGNRQVDKGNWSYFEYCFKSCPEVIPPVCPKDIYNRLCSSQINNPTLTGFTNYYRSLVFLNTPYKTITGTFDPTLANLHEQFLSSGGTGTFTTNYTVKDAACGEITLAISVEVVNCN